MHRFSYFLAVICTGIISISCSSPRRVVSNQDIKVGECICISQLTGDNSITKDAYVSPITKLDNRTPERFDVGGGDLGIIWQISDSEFGILLGDTNGKDFRPSEGGGGNGSNWRSNVLFYTSDTVLEDGLSIDSAAMSEDGTYAREICFSKHNLEGEARGEGDITSIPTSAVHANGCEYIHYFNIKTWINWTTEYSGMYKSTDKGRSWERLESVRFGGDSHFGIVSYWKKGRYIYMVGTQSGRGDGAYMARFREKDIEDMSKYEYWNGNDWITGDEDAVQPIIEDRMGEMSLAWIESLGKWVLMNMSEGRAQVCLRVADSVTGPWSEPKHICYNYKNNLYAPFIHPLSYTGDNQKLYFTLSSWRPYNVYFMSTEILAR